MPRMLQRLNRKVPLMKIAVRLTARALIAIVMMSSANRGEAANPTDPSGTWLVEDGRARIRLERCGPARERICGFIVWMKNPVDARGEPYRDRQNPDPDKRTRALLGHQLLMGLQATPDGRFAGNIYNAEDGKFYSVSLWRDQSDKLKLKGCLIGLFCQTLAADGRRPARAARWPHRRYQRPLCRKRMGGRAGCEGDASEGQVEGQPTLIPRFRRHCGAPQSGEPGIWSRRTRWSKTVQLER